MIATLLNKVYKLIFSDKGWVVIIVAGILGSIYAYYHARVDTLEEAIASLRKQNALLVTSNEEHRLELEKQNASIDKLVAISRSAHDKLVKVADRNKQITSSLNKVVKDIKRDSIDNSCSSFYDYVSTNNDKIAKEWNEKK